MVENKQIFSTEIAGKTFSVEVGELAKQANGSCMVHYGDTSVLAVATASKEPRDLPFFPLMVNYEERLYAVGKIPGGFIKREGRPSEKAVLASRLIDRPIRPLFPEGYRNDVQVISVVLSVDQDYSSEIAAMVGSSIALGISDIPFDGPIAGVNIGRVDGEFIINPTVEEQAESDLFLTVAGTKDEVNMVEAEANEVTEDVILEAIMFGQKEIARLVAFQEEIIQAVGVEKSAFKVFDIEEEIRSAVQTNARENMIAAIKVTEKHAREEAIETVKAETLATYEDTEDEEVINQVKEALDQLVKDEVRRLISQEKIRPDGRRIDEIRALSSRIDVLPRTHGSGLFTRGQTQTLSVCTLGALGDVQILDGLDLEETKRFMHHYNFPQFSVGETGPIRGPGRREIGHGALGERALEKVIPSETAFPYTSETSRMVYGKVIPSETAFPYTIRLVSEVLESNGSSSQASICASTLAKIGRASWRE